MKTIFIEIDKVNSRENLHVYLKDAFGFPDYYGQNLDALYDCLTSIAEPITIVAPTSLRDMLDGYGSQIVRVLEDACGCNEHLCLQTKDNV